MIRRWNQRVAPEDTVYYLGDFSLSKVERLPNIVSALNGNKLLIAGNHDKCHPANRKKAVPIEDYLKLGFEDVMLETTLPLVLKGKETVVKLCHLPYGPLNPEEQTDTRYMDMRPKDEGHLLLHGHVHDTWKKSSCGRMINVGVDVWNFYPISVEDLETVL